LAAAPAKPAKEKEPAYHYVAPIQNPHTVADVYNKSIQSPHITLSPGELFAISPEVHNRLREAIMPKRVLNETVFVRGYLSISLPYLLYSLLSSSTLSTPTPLCAYVHIITKVDDLYLQ
jgi:hypothetical protein